VSPCQGTQMTLLTAAEALTAPSSMALKHNVLRLRESLVLIDIFLGCPDF